MDGISLSKSFSTLFTPFGELVPAFFPFLSPGLRCSLRIRRTSEAEGPV